MYLKSLGSSLLYHESAACCLLSYGELPSSLPKFPLLRKNLSSCRGRPLLQKYIDRKTSPYRSPSSKYWKLHSTDQAQLVVLDDEDNNKTWEDCRLVLSAFDISTQEADLMLKKAFGWIHSPYWGEERSREVPKGDTVNEVLTYLKRLGLSDEDIHKLLKKFPEVLGCDLDGEMKNNVGTLERDWGIKGKALRNLLMRNPKVLGYNVDCRGDCMAKCTRCWVRF